MNNLTPQELQELTMVQKNSGWELDYLFNGSPIFQCKNLYTFSSDAIALSTFATACDNNKVVDLCAGTGVVGLELAERASVSGVKNISIDFVELQPEVFAILDKNTKINRSGFCLNAYCTSVQEFSQKESNHKKYNILLCNPPYFKLGSGKISQNNAVALSRHELRLTLKELFALVKLLAKPNAKFFLVHLTSRGNEILSLAKEYGFSLERSKVLSGKLSRTLYCFLCKM